MPFQPEIETIRWKIHLNSSPEEVYEIISTDKGRNKFWAETTEKNGIIEFKFPNSFIWTGNILKANPPYKYSVRYIDNSITVFQLDSDGKGGTDLTLEDREFDPKYRIEIIAGWGSVLMALKAAVDFNIDLRNHDPTRTWIQGYFDN